MADVLELENAEEFNEVASMDMTDDLDDESISKLKEKAKRRKVELISSAKKC